LSEPTHEGCLAYVPASQALPPLEELRSALRRSFPQPPEHLQLPLHVTLKWLGLRTQRDLDQVLGALLECEAARVAPRVLSAGICEQAGYFGVALQLEPIPELRRLQRHAEMQLQRLGLIDADRHCGAHYAPHLTLLDGVASGAQAKELASSLTHRLEHTAERLGRIDLTSLVLFRKPLAREVLPEIWAHWSATGAC